MRIAIIGGGIGGLTAALALRQFGFDPTVFEQAPELLEVGAAILMWPNAMRVLQRLGLAKAIQQHGAVLEQAVWLRHDGKQLNRFRLPKTDQPAVALHRADLQRVLMEALPRESIRLNHVLAKLEQPGSEVVADFANQPSVTADLLIGADGLHSRARTQLLNDEAPSDRGYVAWRGVTTHTPRSLPPASAIEIHGKGQRFGIGPLGSGKIGWWCSVNKTADVFESATDAKEVSGHYYTESTRERLLNLFRGWCEPISELIQSTPLSSLVHNPTFDRPPVRRWGARSVVLIGDAIHPLTPNLGQGGCLAIEDAAVLARCLEKYAEIPVALSRFETVRYARTAMVGRFSRLYGVVGQWENPAAIGLRGWALSMVPAALVQRVLRWTYDYDAYRVNV